MITGELGPLDTSTHGKKVVPPERQVVLQVTIRPEFYDRREYNGWFILGSKAGWDEEDAKAQVLELSKHGVWDRYTWFPPHAIQSVMWMPKSFS
jgi:hypothetical protein